MNFLAIMCNQEFPDRNKRKRPMKIDNNVKHLNDREVVFSMQIKRNFSDPRNGFNAIRLYDNIN
jgi:hypothetical protein